MVEHVTGDREMASTAEQFEMFFSLSNELLAIGNLEGTFLRINDCWEQLLGYSMDELVGKPVETVIHPNHIQATRRVMKRLLSGFDIHDYETLAIAKNGEEKWIGWSARPAVNDGLIFVVAHEITSRKLAERDWLDISAALENAVEGIARVDTYGRFTAVNQTFAEHLGYRPEDLLGAHWHIGVHPEDVPTLQGAHERMLNDGKAETEARGIKRDGNLSYSQFMLVKALDEKKEYIGHHCFMKDISARKQAEQSLQKTETRLASLLRHVPGVLYQMLTARDGSLSFSYISESVTKILGYEPSEFLGNAELVFDCVYPDDVGLLRELIIRGAMGILPFRHELRCYTKSGEIKWILLSSTPELQPSGDLLWNGLLTDITELKAAEDKIKELNEDLAQRLDVLASVNHELETLTHKLEIAYDQAMEASKLKSEFVANISHEVRTPISAVVGMSELLLDSQLDDEQHQFARIISESAQSLLIIINDILDFSKMEAGRIELEMIDFSLPKIMIGCANWLRSNAREKGLELNTVIDANMPPVVTGDPLRLRQVLLNLATNAIKFTETGSVTMKISMLERDDKVVLIKVEVIDTGIGLADSARKRLFEPFSQADGSTTRKYGGTGLGLSISKRLIEMMQGQIGVESTEGEGATFWFTVPLAISELEELAQEQEFRDTPTSINRLKKMFPLASKVAESMPGETERVTIAAAGFAKSIDHSRTILLAEDNTVLQDLTTKQLEKLGFKVNVVPNGREAVEAIDAKNYALVFMDCQMPEMDGFEATQAIRAREAGTDHHTVIVALTASAMDADRERCLACGMDDYLSKPVRLKQIVEVVQKWLPELNKVQEIAETTAEQKNMPDIQPPDIHWKTEQYRSTGDATVPKNGSEMEALDLESLKSMYGEESLNEILTMFIDEANQLISQMQDSLSAKDGKQLAAASHQLKGVGSSVSAMKLSDLSAELERKAKNSEWVDAETTLVDLSKELSRVTNFANRQLQAQT
jgi:PAS domain S-box-containing protein